MKAVFLETEEAYINIAHIVHIDFHKVEEELYYVMATTVTKHRHILATVKSMEEGKELMTQVLNKVNYNDVHFR